METLLSFSDLRTKDVVNVGDGRRLGRPIDIVFDTHARVKGIVTPCPKKTITLKREEDILIPWNAIIKIGDDVILVDLGCKERPSEVCPPDVPPC